MSVRPDVSKMSIEIYKFLWKLTLSDYLGFNNYYLGFRKYKKFFSLNKDRNFPRFYFKFLKLNFKCVVSNNKVADLATAS